jgi:hypothetical protein
VAEINRDLARDVRTGLKQRLRLLLDQYIQEAEDHQNGMAFWLQFEDDVEATQDFIEWAKAQNQER